LEARSARKLKDDELQRSALVPPSPRKPPTEADPELAYKILAGKLTLVAAEERVRSIGKGATDSKRPPLTKDRVYGKPCGPR
jgi:hypothetical protein